MEKIFLENIQRNISFSRIYGLDQIWQNSRKWSCVGEPRGQHGFMYIFCDSVQFILKNESEPLCFQKGDLVY